MPHVPNARTFRDVDGERIEGISRRIFIRNAGAYHLSELKVFADGSIWCDGWTDIEGLKAKLASGRVATSFQPGARASIHHVGWWTFTEDSGSSVRAEWLLGEVNDELDKLNGRPDSTSRCLQAADRYLRTRAEEDLAALRAAYEAIPENFRIYALGDMDHNDVPLRVLCVGIGGQTENRSGTVITVTVGMHQWALDYFAERKQAREKWEHHAYPDGPQDPASPTVHLNQVIYPRGWPDDPGTLALRNEYPADIEIDRATYPTVVHAYWALAVTGPALAEQIRTADRPYDARKLAEEATIREDWPAIRLAVMARLLRAKFTQHAALASTLLATGDARIEYTGLDSWFWLAGRDHRGRNWTGRLLEVIRSEIAAKRAGIGLGAVVASNIPRESQGGS
jgi:ribA/ribD-fused uncharacterized protein